MATPMSDKESEFIFNKLNNIDKNLAVQFGNTDPEKRKEFVLSLEPVLEGYSEYTDNYNSIYELTGDKYKILNKMYDDFKGKVPSESRLFSLQKKYPFISKEDIENYFSKVDAYRAELKKQDEYEFGKRKREKEVKSDWGWRNYLASEYEKERYINEPQKSLFGKEAPQLGEAPETRTEAGIDLGLGVAGGVSELYPGWGGAIAGPTIRGARDVYHSLSDSPYKKTNTDILKDIGFDLGTNVAIEKLPNFRKQKRITTDIGGKNVTESIAIDDMVSATKKQLENLPTPKELDDLTSEQIWLRVQSLPDSELKKNLQKHTPNIYQVDRDGIAKELERNYKFVEMAEKSDAGIQGYKKGMEEIKRAAYNTKELQELLTKMDVPQKTQQQLENIQKRTQEEYLPKKAFGSREYEARLLNRPVLNTRETLMKPVALGTRKLLNDYGSQAMRIGTDVGFWPGKKSSKVESPEINYTRDFLLGFVPSEDAPVEIKRAYEQWREDYYKKYKVYPEEDNLARIEGR